jgi:hypothetical protein
MIADFGDDNFDPWAAFELQKTHGDRDSVAAVTHLLARASDFPQRGRVLGYRLRQEILSSKGH